MQTLQRMPSQRSLDHQAQLVFRPQSLAVVSPFRRVMIPTAPLPELFLELIEPHGPKVAMEDVISGQRMTFAQLSHGIRQAASGLYHLGVRAGDVVAFCTPSVPEAVVLMQALGLLGAVWTVLPLPHKDGEADAQGRVLSFLDLWLHVLCDSKARFLVTIPPWVTPLADLWMRVAADHPLSDMICIGECPGDVSQLQISGFALRTYAELFDMPAFFPDEPSQNPQDVLALAYVNPREMEMTSLSVSRTSRGKDKGKALAKGIQFTHAALLAALVQSLAADDLHPRDVVLSTSPLHHPHTFSVQLLVPLARGSHLLLISDPSLFSHPTESLSLMSKYRPSRVYISPPLAQSLVAEQEMQDSWRLDCLKVVVGCGSVFSHDLCQRMHRLWGVHVRQMYGHCETILTHGILTGSLTDPLANAPPPPDTIGQLLPNVECRVLNRVTKQPCFINQPGDIYVKSPNCFTGYYKDNTDGIIDKDGWIKTGDFGFFDKRGYFYLLPPPNAH